MGIFDSLVQGIGEVHDDARGRILRDEWNDIWAKIGRLSLEQTTEVMLRFMVKQDRIGLVMVNWSRDGRLKMAQTLRNSAKEQGNFNLVEAYALWMASAWLEAGERYSDDARYVSKQLIETRSEFFCGCDAAFERKAVRERPLAGMGEDVLGAGATLMFQAAVGTRIGLHSEADLDAGQSRMREFVRSRQSYGDRLTLMGLGVALAFDVLAGFDDREGYKPAMMGVVRLGAGLERATALMEVFYRGEPPFDNTARRAEARQLRDDGRMALLRANGLNTTHLAVMATFGHLAWHF